jgi:D-alanyl-D-alanine carboxypeptidase
LRPLLALLALSGCADVATPDGDIACDADFAAHPRHAELQAIVDDRVANGLPGLAVAVRTPDGVWQGTAGYADLERQIALTPCHVHPQASIGKTYHSVAALRLQEAGELDLDAKLADYVPEERLRGLPNADRVTLRQLMDHSSGIPDFNGDLGFLGHEFDDPLYVDTPDETLDWLRGDAPLLAPGEGYAYADTNYMLLAMAIGEVTGDHYAALREQIVAPLGSVHTTFPEPDEGDPEGRVDAYWEVGGGRLENVSDLQSAYDRQIIGAGNVRTTPAEALAFIEAVARGELLSDEARAQMTTWSPHSERDDGWAYGLGLARRDVDGQIWVGHTGGDAGAGAFSVARPDAEYGIVAMTNVGMFLGGPLGAQFDDDLLAELAAAAQQP